MQSFKVICMMNQQHVYYINIMQKHLFNVIKYVCFENVFFFGYNNLNVLENILQQSTFFGFFSLSIF